MTQATVGYLDANGNWVPVRTGSPLPTSGGSVEAPVTSVNSQTGDVVLDAADVSALPDSYTPPAPSWGSVTGKPSSFPPSAHQHPISDVTNLQSQLDGKSSTTHTHSFASLAGAVTGATGADLQAILEDIVTRLAAVEAP